MSSKTSPWLIGCGIGCAGLLLVAVVVGAGGFFFVRETMSGFETAVETRAELERKFGAADAFTPWPAGPIPAPRMDAFLKVREATQPARERIAAAFEALPTRPGEAEELEAMPFFQRMRAALSIAGTGIGLGKTIGLLFETRNQALLEAEMGMGEYTLIYVLAYYSWLKHPPDDGPVKESGRIRVDTSQFDSRVRRRILAMFANWSSQPVPESWAEALEKEIQSLKKDRGRVPFQDGLPEALAQSLEPYKDRLEAAYSQAANQFELALNRKRGRWSIKAE